MKAVKVAVFAVFGFAVACAVAAPRLAFQVYAVRDLCERDFVGTLKAAKAIGYEGVETGRFYGLDAKGLKEACDEALCVRAKRVSNCKFHAEFSGIV
ncbi:MAG: hypothetical protein II840_06505 [Kiritimatiellae bacterium]|nr:hypothetical protein [Kiritimatiellia bacterium]